MLRSKPPPPPPPKKREHAQTVSSTVPQSTPKLVPSTVKSKRLKGSAASNVRLLRTCAGLRDVEVYEKISKVGQGTYGSVFLGKDKVGPRCGLFFKKRASWRIFLEIEMSIKIQSRYSLMQLCAM